MACGPKQSKQLHIDDMSAWCVVSFDSLDRSPADRIAMLKDLGFSTYGYNWKERHLPIMAEEFALAKENGLDIHAIFLWLNPKRDSIGKLSPLNQQMLQEISKVENKPAIWTSLSESYFKGLNHQESLELSQDYVNYIKKEASRIGVTEIGLYNHSGWFGDIYNQVELLENLGNDQISIVYNFHHGHQDIDQFLDIVNHMLPHLSYVNLNGMKKGATKENGMKILDIGKGEHEANMIKTLQVQGYEGPWGIIGHINDEDVRIVLERNIEGLESICGKIK